ncbi:MAG: DUF3429 domain-containing protein [Burkholderiaceae bacterium]|jgi:hypothetical protein|nr:DUF3429 domain-containing protein [Burkholderiaceae bacterium]
MYDFHQSTHNKPDEPIPRAALIPGLLGLVPILVLSWTIISPGGFLNSSQALMALNSYAAIILTFVGALWWGLAARTPKSLISHSMLVWSVVPALFAWSVMLMASRTALNALIAGFIVQWSLDSVMMYVAAGILPFWVYRLRTILTLLVVSILTFTAWYIH